MIKHGTILDHIRALRAEEEKSKREYTPQIVNREEVLLFSFKEGEKVFDTVTELEGEVIYVTRKRITEVPVPESEGA